MKKSKMKFSKKIIILMFATMIIFTITMIVTFWRFQSIPDSLVDRFFGFFGVESGALGIIKIGETFADKFEIKKGSKKK